MSHDEGPMWLNRVQRPIGLHAWVDESMRLSLDDKGAYVLAATIREPAHADPVRTHLRSLLLPGQSRLHWHDEGDSRRSMIAKEIAICGMASVVVVGTPVVRAKQERARRLCMEVLLPELHAIGVQQVWYESRTHGLNKQDARMVSALRGKQLLPSSMRVDPARPTEEPMLWVPDAVAGAVNADYGDDARWLQVMSGTVRIIEIALR